MENSDLQQSPTPLLERSPENVANGNISTDIPTDDNPYSGNVLTGYYILHSNFSPKDHRKYKSPSTLIKSSSIGHLVTTGMSVVTQVSLLFFVPYINMNAFYSGLWCSVVYAAAGTAGLIAHARSRKHWYITYMILSILATIFSVVMLGMSLLSLYTVNLCSHTIDYFNSGMSLHSPPYFCGPNLAVVGFLCGTLLSLSLVEMIVAISSSVVSGVALRCACCIKQPLHNNNAGSIAGQHTRISNNLTNTTMPRLTTRTYATTVPNFQKLEAQLEAVLSPPIEPPYLRMEF